jgi:hypothetical protein
LAFLEGLYATPKVTPYARWTTRLARIIIGGLGVLVKKIPAGLANL